MPWLGEAVEMDGLFVATLPSLFKHKARAWWAREEEKADAKDMLWIVQACVRKGFDYDPLFLLFLLEP